MVGRDRRDAAEIVDARVDQLLGSSRSQVGGRLDAHGRAEDDPRHGDGPQMLLDGRLGRPRHARARLGQEILDDDLLQVTVLGVGVPEGKERVEALRLRLADADQDAAGERDAQLSGGRDGLKADRGGLVGGAEVSLSALHQPRRGTFQHDALRHRDVAQHRDLVALHDAGVHVRQKPRLFEDDPAHLGEIFERRRMAQPRQLVPRCRIAELRLVAEGEQGLLAAGRRAAPCDIEDFVAGEVGAAELLGGLGEHAIMANVPAELGERDEDLLGEADDAAMPGIAQARPPAPSTRRAGPLLRGHECAGRKRLREIPGSTPKATPPSGSPTGLRRPGTDCLAHVLPGQDEPYAGRTDRSAPPVSARLARKGRSRRYTALQPTQGRAALLV